MPYLCVMTDAIDEETTTCPTCGERGTPIVYGYPSLELFEAASRREVVLGGCVVTGDDPTHECPNGHRWRVVASA